MGHLRVALSWPVASHRRNNATDQTDPYFNGANGGQLLNGLNKTNGVNGGNGGNSVLPERLVDGVDLSLAFRFPLRSSLLSCLLFDCPSEQLRFTGSVDPVVTLL
jgi:hypothetical protein